MSELSGYQDALMQELHQRWHIGCTRECGGRLDDYLAAGRMLQPGGVLARIAVDAYRRGQRDLAAKVEALCDRADGSASDDPDVRDEIGEAWIKARELRALLADALPQDADSEPEVGR